MPPKDRINIFEADFSYKPVLRQLIELYQYDYSIYDDTDVNEHGYFDYKWIDHYWTEQTRRPFLFRCDNKLAGFALVRELDMDFDYSIAEFFVMKKYRRRGIGRNVALHIFNSFKGRWELTVYEDNEAAKHFWQSVIGEVADNLEMRFVENRMPARWRYRFSNTDV